MTKPRFIRTIIVATTVLFACVEFLLFDLRRAPYNPPYDMRTLLGSERDCIYFFMAIIAGGWLLAAISCAMTFRFTLRDYLCFAMLVGLLITVAGILVAYPWWPVTPPELMWS